MIITFHYNTTKQSKIRKTIRNLNLRDMSSRRGELSTMCELEEVAELELSRRFVAGAKSASQEQTAKPPDDGVR